VPLVEKDGIQVVFEGHLHAYPGVARTAPVKPPRVASQRKPAAPIRRTG